MDYVAGKGTTAMSIIGTVLGGAAVAGVPLLKAMGVKNCGDDPANQPVSRYEAAQAARIAELETEVKLRDSNIYTDQKSLEMYKHFDGKLNEIESRLCDQAVTNQRTADSFALAAADLAAVKAELKGDIKMEAERRCCADNAIITYANATFYPKQVADVTVGTANTAQTLYNPIPKCGGCCCNGNG